MKQLLRKFILFPIGIPLILSMLSTASFYRGKSYTKVIPQRPVAALKGSEFLAKTKYMSEAARENAILKEIRNGNIPNFLRHLEPVYISQKGSDGKIHKMTLWVMPDYLAIGSDTDFVRIPMTPRTAQVLAQAFDYSLPTTKLVDEIYKNSDVALRPSPMTPGPRMTTNDYYLKHNFKIEGQLSSKDRLNLIGGHKKDVVITRRLEKLPSRVAIYGWHKNRSNPIQPLSLVHGMRYADYSHGIRFVHQLVVVDGKKMNINEVLQNPVLSSLISYEGAIDSTNYY